MNNQNQEAEKPIIIIEEKPDYVPGQGEGEKPVITVERQEPERQSKGPKKHHNWVVALASAILAVLCSCVLFYGWRYYRNNIVIGVDIAVTPEQNIEKLATPDSLQLSPEVRLTSDSVLGVALNIYDLCGLRAEISMQEPDTLDQSVYLYSRCADYHKDFSIIGSMVIDGEEVPTVDNKRLGYFAAANNKFVIGISRSEEVKEYVKQHGGCFFRQFILLSGGMIPRQFYLHGKVERRGIGRKYGSDKLYYIETLHKETMWDFADALREYGFEDAIYITGGKDFCFYRTADGERHVIGNEADYPHKYAGQVPWLVFKSVIDVAAQTPE